MAEDEEGSLASWSCEDVGQWLQEQGFGEYSPLLCSQHKIDGAALLCLSEDDLKQPPIQMTVLGDIKRLMSRIHRLQMLDQDLNVGAGDPLTPVVKSLSLTAFPSQQPQRPPRSVLSDDKVCRSSPLLGAGAARVGRRPRYQSSFSRDTPSLDPEYCKTLLSFFYVFSVFLLTAFVMVIVHDRVPDMQKYPPLPDLFLDNMPYVPWAFTACELTGTVLCCMWVGVLVCHKHRFILLRRMFSLLGTIFLLRCVTMLITSMSVPGRHLHCVGKRYGDWWSRLERTLEIWKGLGMTLQGVKSCGDYMFSGHTVIITILNFFITEYTPALRCYYVHVVSWVLNMFGLFFILAAHEHYCIDVFMAFYLTSRLFLYYHTLANTRSLTQQDATRTRIWFPMFAFFESHCDGAVPNEYQWPTWPGLPDGVRDFLWSSKARTSNDAKAQ